MANNTIVDTGIVVGLINHRDYHHQWCKKKSADLKPPFYTCEAVLSESFHLIEPLHNGASKLLGFLQKGLIRVPFSYMQHVDAVHQLIRTYSNLPCSFADACLVQMAETIPSAQLFTLDTDFTIYRTADGQPLSLISPN